MCGKKLRIDPSSGSITRSGVDDEVAPGAIRYEPAYGERQIKGLIAVLRRGETSEYRTFFKSTHIERVASLNLNEACTIVKMKASK